MSAVLSNSTLEKLKLDLSLLSLTDLTAAAPLKKNSKLYIVVEKNLTQRRKEHKGTQRKHIYTLRILALFATLR